MTATSLNVLRNGINPDDPKDERMDQVRELLIGDYARASDDKIATLEAKLHELEADLSNRIDAISARLEALAGETCSDRRTSFEELAKNVSDLSEQIRRISRT